MNYNKIYYSIIENRRKHVIKSGYYEKHHILPRSLGGSNKSDNIVKLSAKEHYICHLLLTKMYKFGTCEWYKMHSALRMMLVTERNQDRHISSKKFSFYRQEHAKWMKFCQSGKRNSQYGSKIVYNIETGKKRRIQLGEELTTGWCDSITWKKIKKQKLKATRKEKIRIDVIKIHDKFKESGCKSLREFCKLKFYNRSHVSLTNKFKKYIPDLYMALQGKPYKTIL